MENQPAESHHESTEPAEPVEYTPYETYWRQLVDWMLRFEDDGGVDPACFDLIHEYMQVGELTEAIRLFAAAVYNTGRSDDEIDRFANEFEIICQRLQTVAPFVFYGEAVAAFRRNARET
jgi:hypothetical protein